MQPFLKLPLSTVSRHYKVITAIMFTFVRQFGKSSCQQKDTVITKENKLF